MLARPVHPDTSAITYLEHHDGHQPPESR
jgi:hypothetical protein